MTSKTEVLMQAIGGTTFAATVDGREIGRIECGSIDANGQWVEDADWTPGEVAREELELGDGVKIVEAF